MTQAEATPENNPENSGDDSTASLTEPALRSVRDVVQEAGFYRRACVLTREQAAAVEDNGGGRVDYLRNKGTTSYAVDGENVVFCTSGSTKIYGSNIYGVSGLSSYCQDVASGAQAIINSCNQGGYVAGANAATGNGNLIVSINH